MTATYTPQNRQICFAGTDDPEKLKSIRPAKGVFTDIWFEEATEISEPAFNQILLRQRGGDPDIVKRTTLSFNPIYRTHWIVKRFFKGVPESGVYRSDKLLIVHSTHKDNRFLTSQDRDIIEAMKEVSVYHYQVYALGQWGILGNRVFDNWKIIDTDETKYDNYRNGLDFGFTNDPSALARSVRKENKITVLYPSNGELYHTGLTNQQLAKILKSKLGDSEVVWCDNSEPKSIAELKLAGVNAKPVKKGKDSLIHGIQWLQQQKIEVDRRCQNAINELSIYQWKKDKDDESINIPVDANNHFIDALRYSYEREMDYRKPLMVLTGKREEYADD